MDILVNRLVVIVGGAGRREAMVFKQKCRRADCVDFAIMYKR